MFVQCLNILFIYQGQTPLMRAAARGFVEAVQILLNAHANTDIRDLDGQGIYTDYCP